MTEPAPLSGSPRFKRDLPAQFPITRFDVFPEKWIRFSRSDRRHGRPVLWCQELGCTGYDLFLLGGKVRSIIGKVGGGSRLYN
jgi:hypothetical protein